MIELEGLTKQYGRTVAVDDLSFRVEPGRVTGFLGPNGAGKSTTMRMILGVDRPPAGRVLVDGAEVGLANKEFELLRVLMLRAGQVVTREEILREVWNDPDMKTSKTLDMHMSWLRRKIGGERRIGPA